MGEISEMMLDGTLCSSCGEYLGGEGDDGCGYPQQCAGCQPDVGDEYAYRPARLSKTRLYGEQDLVGFSRYLKSRGGVEQEPRGEYEAYRCKGKKTGRIVIVFQNKKGQFRVRGQDSDLVIHYRKQMVEGSTNQS